MFVRSFVHFTNENDLYLTEFLFSFKILNQISNLDFKFTEVKLPQIPHSLHLRIGGAYLSFCPCNRLHF
jgi:hypothetical protein